ncbi:hypothetical protein D9757_014735 [Collybiopsis confluens]|uniref:Uncharacterized protein n=1 Tax=Collybiopsis confluens TaxID=2823264 RepID=A0A8H5LUD5_9AGAR|nr:hypothetical protein D9757_014735 [Collybiopsis confluens]
MSQIVPPAGAGVDSHLPSPKLYQYLQNSQNLSPDVGPLGILRVSGSLRVDKASEDSIPSGHQPAAILDITSLEEAGKRISQDILMRRLARILSDDTGDPPLRHRQLRQLESVLPSRKGGRPHGLRLTLEFRQGPPESKKRRRNNASSSSHTRKPDTGGSGPGTSDTKATVRRRLNKITALATGQASPAVPPPEPSVVSFELY